MSWKRLSVQAVQQWRSYFSTWRRHSYLSWLWCCLSQASSSVVFFLLQWLKLVLSPGNARRNPRILARGVNGKPSNNTRQLETRLSFQALDFTMWGESVTKASVCTLDSRQIHIYFQELIIACITGICCFNIVWHTLLLALHEYGMHCLLTVNKTGKTCS